MSSLIIWKDKYRVNESVRLSLIMFLSDYTCKLRFDQNRHKMEGRRSLWENSKQKGEIKYFRKTTTIRNLDLTVEVETFCWSVEWEEGRKL